MLSDVRLLGVIAVALALFGVSVGCSPESSSTQEDQTFAYSVPVRAHRLCPDEPRPPQPLTAACVDNVNKALDVAGAAGVNSIDYEVGWAWTSQADYHGGDPAYRREYDWRYVDLMVAETEERDMEITFKLDHTPDWVHPYLNDSSDPRYEAVHDARRWHPPRGDAELLHWENFIRDVVGRYKGRVAHYEIWNEPNHPPFWQTETGAPPEAAEYVPLLRRAYLAAKDVYPGATIVSGGLSGNDLGYLRAYYEAARTYPDAATSDYFFDVLGLHPYAQDRFPDYRNSADWDRRGEKPVPEGCENRPDLGSCNATYYTGFSRVKKLMDAQEGDAAKKMFFSEYGVPSSATVESPGVGDARRALYLKRAYEMARAEDYITGMSWYAYHSHGGDSPAWAIVDDAFNPSLTYRAYKQVTGAEAADAQIAIDLADDVSGVQSINPRLTNLSGCGIATWELWVIGDDPRLSSSAPVNTQTTTPISWDTTSVNDGHYWVMVAAYTTEGSVWTSNWDLVKVGNTAPTVGGVTPDDLEPTVAPGDEVDDPC